MAIELLDLKPKQSDFKEDVVHGLSANPKTLKPMYFYDELGSNLFDQICELDEYYPTRTEMAILDEHAAAIDDMLMKPCTIIEFGSGSSAKIKKLLETSNKVERYIPIDISKEHLVSSVKKLAEAYPKLAISAVCADYTDWDSLDKIRLHDANSKVVFFPGSTIGNLEEKEAQQLLKNTKNLIGSDGEVILGIDLIKDRRILLNAYNDSQGVTAKFNLNLLSRINSELNGTFAIENFVHESRYNEEKSRIEMHLISTIDQSVNVDKHTFHFLKNESIHTESSHKYNLETLSDFFGKAGLKVKHCFTDEDSKFAVAVLV